MVVAQHVWRADRLSGRSRPKFALSWTLAMPHGERPALRSAQKRKGLPTTSPTVLRPCRCCTIWRPCVRSEVFQMRAPRGSRGHEQSGSRYAVVVQSDQLPLSTWLVAPTSTSARAASFRPEVEISGVNTRVLAEQAAAVDPGPGSAKAPGSSASTRCAAPMRHCASSWISEHRQKDWEGRPSVLCWAASIRRCAEGSISSTRG